MSSQGTTLTAATLPVDRSVARIYLTNRLLRLKEVTRTIGQFREHTGE